MRRNKEELYRIYEKYKYLMFSIAFDILRDSHSAEDAVQDAFVKIINHFEKMDDLESNRTKRLIITITKNTAIDVYRKRSIRWNRERKLDELSDIEMNYQVIDSGNELVTAIESLSDKYKDVIFLRYSSGFSIKEIAEILEISEANVRKRISRAKKMIENNLERS